MDRAVATGAGEVSVTGSEQLARAGDWLVAAIAAGFWEVVGERRPPAVVYAMALDFEWGQADWYRWIPTPILLDERRLEILAAKGERSALSYWDPWEPTPDEAARELAPTAGAMPTRIKSNPR